MGCIAPTRLPKVGHCDGMGMGIGIGIGIDARMTRQKQVCS
jgi:hypothetical protein